eukprot:TRINITY_DN73449_c0_g1_i1.p1 TRINITY_DN73449_c0_g1~~TRINITY_DN73449_c0_g1_i1.p1  ORF type:complete len:133 (+),score=34.01 TRINITY_DN73449_c0_g1_i1:3-401(+)
MSKINSEHMKKCIAEILENRKERKFTESIDMQVKLRDYNPDKEKRLNTTLMLSHQARTTQKVMVIAMLNHKQECEKLGVDVTDLDGLKKFNNQAKKIKQWARKYDVILVSEGISRNATKLIGKTLSSVNRLP